MTEGFTFLGKVEEITGLSHGDLAQIVGMPRSSVQAIICGRMKEWLNAGQILALLNAARLFRDRAIVGVEELELMQ